MNDDIHQGLGSEAQRLPDNTVSNVPTPPPRVGGRFHRSDLLRVDLVRLGKRGNNLTC